MINFFTHSIRASLFSDCVIKFGKSGKHGFKQFLGRLVADGFGNRVKSYAVVHENLSDREVIIGVTRESIHAQDHENLNIALVFAAEFKGPQEFLSVVHTQILGALTFFTENFQDLDAFFLAVFAAVLFLGFKRGAFYLLVARNSYVNDSFHDFLCVSMR